ncbi:HDOD domain-containing protein [Pseudoduganella plicata]|uniref:HD family phosphohydrolase n=1 Tax=Pseudoduganella plicata TaxID=321984 RepID=A0A4V1ATA7_9BURK|nr:HDOD domain-containing protein [Pseudoduganella plicata]QBQ35008.1 HDOD domain-containing protein [Pseudoduganella plicata]GGZ06759.1 HD family phosphohydrolase [Pseudoduganella plicata]
MKRPEDIIRSVRDLPSLPGIVAELLATMEQEDIDTHALAARITQDQALTAKTLRLANSSFYGLQSKVTSIAQAVSVLGFHAIRTLVTACSVTASFAPRPGGQFDFPAFWRHAIASAVCARVLARHLRVNVETAFTAGLLHDLGTLVLVTRLPDEYTQVVAWQREHDCTAATAEQALFGTDHAAVGAALAAHWKFPQQIQAAVAGHHTVLPDDDLAPADLTTVVQAANVLAHALDLGGPENDQAPPLSLAVWRAFALDEAAWDGVFSEAEQLYREMCGALAS